MVTTADNPWPSGLDPFLQIAVNTRLFRNGEGVSWEQGVSVKNLAENLGER
jgi:hypothetical protein